MRQSEWFAERRGDDNAEKEENRYEGRRSDGKRGRVPWRWRRGSSEGHRRGFQGIFGGARDCSVVARFVLKRHLGGI